MDSTFRLESMTRRVHSLQVEYAWRKGILAQLTVLEESARVGFGRKVVLSFWIEIKGISPHTIWFLHLV